jgi:hypothetical protein
MTAPFIASRVYLKPLLPKKFKGDTEIILKKAKKDLSIRLKEKLMQTALSDRAKVALLKAIKIEVKPSSVRVTANHPAFAPLVYGQRKGQMKWLKKARKPIPIVTDDGKLIFRNATARSMKNGHWVHPGRPPSDFVSSAKEASRVYLKKKFAKEIIKQMRIGK